MEKGFSNEQIEDFLKIISNKDEYYASYSEKAFLKNYDACDDYDLTEELIDDIWQYMRFKFSGFVFPTIATTPISILHTNAGSGKILEACPSKNVFINAMNNDYICKRISDLINASTSLDFTYNSSITDISHFFINGDNGNTRKHDIVMTQPSSNKYYSDIDGTRLSVLRPAEYYSLRSLDFLTKGGYLCVLVPSNKFNTLKINTELNNKAKLVKEIHNNRKFDEYGCLIYKKR